VYFAFGSIIGNTFVSDAAANIVGREPREVLDDIVDGEDESLVALDLLLPQPTISGDIATETAAAARPNRAASSNSASPHR
jgi:hypothetical protein